VIADISTADVMTVAAPVIVLGLTRILLMMQRTPSQKLPPPAKIGLPSGRLAPPSAVHAALASGKARRRWLFGRKR
jgi:hypothetical protein